MRTTRPESAAWIAVPDGTAMSMPACRRPHRIPKGDTTGPFTGQISAPLPCFTGPSKVWPAPWRAACTRACSRSRAARSPSSATRLSRTCASAPRLSSRAVARAGELVLDCGDLVALAEDALRGELLLLLEVGELDRLVPRRVAELPHAVGDVAILLGDALEELGALEQVAEAVGRQDHGEGVRRVGLVDLDEAGGEDAARRGELAAKPLQPVARLLEPVAHL